MKSAPSALVASSKRDLSIQRCISQSTSQPSCPSTTCYTRTVHWIRTSCSRSLHSKTNSLHVNLCHNGYNSSSSTSPRKIPQPCRASLAASAQSMDTAPLDVQPCDALIVGAGPAGLGTALLLRQRAGWKRIVVLESRPSGDSEDADKSYVYMIDGRGQSLMAATGLSEALDAAGVSTKSMSITAVNPDGTAQTRVMSIKDGSRYNVWLPRRALLRVLHSGLQTTTTPQGKVEDAMSAEGAQGAHNTTTTASPQHRQQGNHVSIQYSTKVTTVHLNGALSTPSSSQTPSASLSTLLTPPAANIQGPAATAPTPPPSPPQPPPSPYATPIVVHAIDTTSGKPVAFAPRLLVGADGLNSGVLRALQDVAAATGLPSDHYKPVTHDSPSAGLRYKILQLPPNTPYRRPPAQTQATPQATPQPSAAAAAAAASASGSSSSSTDGVVGQSKSAGAGEAGALQNDTFCKVVGVEAPRKRAMSLGMLPVRDPTAPRTGNIIAPADHEVWSFNRGPELGAFLQESFPQLDIRALFTPEQLEAAAAARGGAFPRPQYVRHFTAALKPSVAGSSGGGGGSALTPAGGGGGGEVCAIALVGDAVHCFPPDLGQGVNSALQDVMGLAAALDEASGDLRSALALYESRRAPEAEALVQLMTFSAPYQYNQDSLRRALWFGNMAVRGALSKVAPWFFSPASFLLIQQADLSYAEVLSRAHATTGRMQALLGALMLVPLAAAVKAAMAAVNGHVPV